MTQHTLTLDEPTPSMLDYLLWGCIVMDNIEENAAICAVKIRRSKVPLEQRLRFLYKKTPKRKPNNKFSGMIQCDLCSSWFELAHVQISTQEAKKQVNKFGCVRCSRRRLLKRAQPVYKVKAVKGTKICLSLNGTVTPFK